MNAPAKIAPRKTKAPKSPLKVERVPVRWHDGASRAIAIRTWRRAVMDACAGRSRAITVAWCLEWLVSKDGQATATNEFLAAETGLPRQHVAPALDDLDNAGLIERHPAPGRRRVIVPTFPTGLHGHQNGGHCGHQIGSPAGHSFGGSNTKGKQNTVSSVRRSGGAHEAARMAAENRERGVTFQSLMAEREGRGGGGRA